MCGTTQEKAIEKRKNDREREESMAGQKKKRKNNLYKCAA
jgi:hypothetical protein